MSSDPACPRRPPLCLRTLELGRGQSSQGGEMGHCTQMPFSREEFTGDHSRVGSVYAARKQTTREGRGGGRRGGASGWPEGKRMKKMGLEAPARAPVHLRAPGRTWRLQDGHLQLWAPARVALLPPERGLLVGCALKPPEDPADMHTLHRQCCAAGPENAIRNTVARAPAQTYQIGICSSFHPQATLVHIKFHKFCSRHH